MQTHKYEIRPHFSDLRSYDLCTISDLSSIVDGVVVDDHLVDLPVLSKVLVSLQNLGVCQSRGQPNSKDKIPLHYPETKKNKKRNCLFVVTLLRFKGSWLSLRLASKNFFSHIV